MSISIQRELNFINKEIAITKQIIEKINEMKELQESKDIYSSPLSQGTGFEFIKNSLTFYSEVGLMLDGAAKSKKALLKNWENWGDCELSRKI